jgi:DNA-binding NtrC family response regulator
MISGDAADDSTVDEPVRPEQDPERPQPHLFVVLHCDHPALGGARYSLGGLDDVLIGRSPRRSALRDPLRRRLELGLPGRTVSGQHARLEWRSESWSLIDAQSHNGCFVNGERTTEAELRDGDVLQIGNALLRFRAALPDRADFDSLADPPPAPGLCTLLPALDARMKALEPIARSPVAVLLLGETGTGKEVLARAIHTLSGRPGAFVPVNCGALAAGLLESLLFGHKKGAFTGALRDEPGYVRAAHEGTLFLDEIGDMPLAAQAALLRVLQEREVVPVGDTRPCKVDLRVVAATHQDLDLMAARGAFRSDLLARLSGYCHELVPLRERREDLGLLVGELLGRPRRAGAKMQRLTSEVGQLLLHYNWPLNIRELEQCLASSSALANASIIRQTHLPPKVSEFVPLSRLPSPTDKKLEELRKNLLLLLEHYQGNVSHIARALNTSRTHVHRLLQRCGLDPNAYRRTPSTK